MKCPYCKEEIERFSQTCNVCGEHIPKIFGIFDNLKEIISKPDTKKIIKKGVMIISVTVTVIVLIVAIIWAVRYTMDVIDSNKFTDNGYKSVVRSDNYTYVSHLHTDLSQMTDKIVPLLEDIATEEKDLMTFFKKSKSTENNVKLFTIFMTNVDKFKEDAELIYNNSSATFDSLGITTSETIVSNQNKPVAIIKPAIHSFYLITENSDYVFFRYDYEYMLKTYAPYLSDDWKEFFTLIIEDNKAFKGVDYEDPKYSTLAKTWSKKWWAFVDKYPKFMYASEFSEYAYELNSY